MAGTFTFYTDFTMQLFTRNGIPFLMQAWWQFVISCVIFIGVSLKTPPPSHAQINRCTFLSTFHLNYIHNRVQTCESLAIHRLCLGKSEKVGITEPSVRRPLFHHTTDSWPV